MRITMKTAIYSIFGLALSVSLAGCETSSQAYSIYEKGGAGFSCGEISKAFAAYKADRNSTEGLAVLVPLISSATGVDASAAGSTSDAYYEQAKSAANVALMVQSCPVIQ